MKNPIPYTKEDIYMIVEIFNNYDSRVGFVPIKHVVFIKNLIQCLTPEERENENVQEFLDEYNLEDVKFD